MTSGVSRLHIKPLSPDLLPIILGRAVHSAQNVSYHQIQSAPQDSYGYVELPKMEADKVKQKVHGATLKGNRIRIEDAKPRKRKHEEVDPSAGLESVSALSRKANKDKAPKVKENVVPGHVLAADRKIKRGWTEAKKGKAVKKSERRSDRQQSKYTNKEELLFRTKLPPNKSDAILDKSKKSKKRSDAQLIHEFEKTTAQPSFIKQGVAEAQGELEYIDGKGWVDDKGIVVEPEPSNMRAKSQRKPKSGQARSSQPRLPQPAPSTNTNTADETEPAGKQPPLPNEDETPSSVAAEAETSSSSSAPSTPQPGKDTITEQTNSLELHPLEALFKKPQKPASSQDIAKPSLELTTSNFSFFEGEANDDIEEEWSVPGTPYSSQDVRNRGLRSAAPTPDTAHPSRFNSYGSSSFHDEDGDIGSEEEEVVRPESSGQVKSASQIAVESEPSEFEKMFWEKRGDNNRAWKARRRTVLKEKRQRENRARRPRNW